MNSWLHEMADVLERYLSLVLFESNLQLAHLQP